MNRIIFMLAITLSIVACKKDDTYTKTKTTDKYNIVMTYKKNQLIYSISYDKKTNKKVVDYRYNAKGTVTNGTKYYSNGKIESTLKLYSLPDCYFSEEYFPTGILAAEGNVIFFHKMKTVRTGPWIVYKQDGSVYAFAEYIVDKKNEKQMLIKKQVIPKNLRLVKKNGKLVEDKSR